MRNWRVWLLLHENVRCWLRQTQTRAFTLYMYSFKAENAPFLRGCWRCRTPKRRGCDIQDEGRWAVTILRFTAVVNGGVDSDALCVDIVNDEPCWRGSAAAADSMFAANIRLFAFATALRTRKNTGPHLRLVGFLCCWLYAGVYGMPSGANLPPVSVGCA